MREMPRGSLKLWVSVVIVSGLVASLLLLTVGAGAVWPDRAVPRGFSQYADEARSSLRRHIEGIRFVHFRLETVRCRDDGGVAYVFEQIEAPYLQTRYAVAMTATMPPSGFGSGGVGLTEAEDPELRYFLAGHEVPCAER